MLNFGQRLLFARRKQGIRQEDLAEVAGVNPNTISRAERSTSATLSGEVIRKIAQHLQVSSDFLLCLSEKETIGSDKEPTAAVQRGS